MTKHHRGCPSATASPADVLMTVVRSKQGVIGRQSTNVDRTET